MSRPPHVLIDALEHRRHFAAATTDSTKPLFGFCPCNACAAGRQQQSATTFSLQSTPAAAAIREFSVRVNFTPEGAPRARGHKTDYGARFAQRGNGLRYGWSSDRRQDATYTDDARYNSPKAESNVLMKGATWSINVPNGWYDVRALMGTPSNLDANYVLNVNGQKLVNGKPYKPNFPWVEGQTVVRVTNGRLTLASDSGSVANRLCSVGVMAVDSPVQAPMGASISWTRTALQSPLHRAEAQSVRVGDRLFVMGGFTRQYFGTTNRVDILNVKTGRWTRAASMPGAQTHFGAATDGTSIYVAGGQYGPMLSIRGTTEVWRYDIASNRWSSFTPLPSIRFGGTMQHLNGRLHFVGGNDKSRVRSQDEHYIFDLRRPRKGWYEAAPLPQPTDHHSSVIVNGKLYILGGEVEHGTSYLQNDGFFQYDANANAWITLPPLPVASSHNEASTLTDGKRIFLIGGQKNQQQLIDDVRSFDFERNRWVMHTPLPTARKAGISWIDGNRLFYMTGDDIRFGEPRWTYAGTLRG
jgi:hypothetical protein